MSTGLQSQHFLTQLYNCIQEWQGNLGELDRMLSLRVSEGDVAVATEMEQLGSP